MSKIRRWITLTALCTFTACSALHPLPSNFKQTSIPPSVVITPVVSESDQISFFGLNELDTPVFQTSHTQDTQDSILVHALAERFHKPETLIQRVVAAATRFAYGSFPLRNSILAIIAVESSFDPYASYKGSKGLMQIQMASHREDLAGRNPCNIETNVEVGSKILHQYFTELHGNEHAAVLAYNYGIGNYKNASRHGHKNDYYKKYVAELQFIRSISA